MFLVLLSALSCSTSTPDPATPRTFRDVPGKWRNLPKRAPSELSSDEQALIEQLEAIGYADGVEEIQASKVITVHDRTRAKAGLNLYTDGHGPVATLMDMDGNVLHEWSTTYWKAFPASMAAEGDWGTDYLRRVRLGDDGDLYAIFEGRGVLKLDAESHVRWAVPNGAHHDIVRNGDGIVVLTRKADVFPDLGTEPVLHDYIVYLDARGRETKRVDLFEALLESEHAHLFHDAAEKTGDVFHTNSVWLLTEAQAKLHPAWKPGFALVSIRQLNAIGVVDPDAQRFVWAATGPWRHQHDATLREDGTLMLFDNEGLGRRSRVLALTLPDLDIAWSYEGTDAHPFFTGGIGASQELPDGHVLITESNGGRGFEVDRNGEIVWEFYVPHRAGDHQQFIATLMEVERLGPEIPSWARRPPR
ncbi:MAG: arylsulfotransferase family protein [Myxococcota bacterium]